MLRGRWQCGPLLLIYYLSLSLSLPPVQAPVQSSPHPICQLPWRCSPPPPPPSLNSNGIAAARGPAHPPSQAWWRPPHRHEWRRATPSRRPREAARWSDPGPPPLLAERQWRIHSMGEPYWGGTEVAAAQECRRSAAGWRGLVSGLFFYFPINL